MEKKLLNDIIMLLVRRVILATGVGVAVTGDDAQQVGGAIAALISVLWSVALKVKQGKVNDGTGN